MTWQSDLEAARSDPEAAARVLGHAADFMRKGKALPAPLAEHIAGAFEDAARQGERRKRAEVLAHDLFLFGREGRPPVPVDGEALHWAIAFSDGESQTQLVKALARRRGVSEGTMRNRLAAYREQQDLDVVNYKEFINSLSESELDAWLKDPLDEERERVLRERESRMSSPSESALDPAPSVQKRD